MRRCVSRLNRRSFTPLLRRRFGTFGLTNSSSNGQYYARQLKLDRSEVIQLVEPGLMWKAAEADAKEKGVAVVDYLEQVNTKATAFLESKEVYDREELLAALQRAASIKGGLILVLGGKSLGKSKIMQHVASEVNKGSNVMVVVDARKAGPDIAEGIANALDPMFTGGLKEAWKQVFSEGMNVSVGPVTIGGAFKPKQESVLKLLDHLTNRRNGHGIIGFDEANLAFKEAEKAKKDLELFVSLTKQERTHTVFLISSEHAFPFHLQKRLDFNPYNVTKTIFVGEVPPKQQLAQLTEKWGMGKELASLCLATYGGHSHYTQLAVQHLMDLKEKFTGDQGVPITYYNSITSSLLLEEAQTGQKSQQAAKMSEERMEQLLRQLAEKGFAPLGRPLDPHAELLSLNNIAGVVSRQATVIGLPEDVWGRYNYGLVPACAMVRLMIIKELLDKETMANYGA